MGQHFCDALVNYCVHNKEVRKAPLDFSPASVHPPVTKNNTL